MKIKRVGFSRPFCLMGVDIKLYKASARTGVQVKIKLFAKASRRACQTDAHGETPGRATEEKTLGYNLRADCVKLIL